MTEPYRLRIRGEFSSRVLEDIREFGHVGSEIVAHRNRSRDGGLRTIIVDDQTWSAISYVLVCLSLLDEPEQDATYKVYARHAKAALARCAAAGWTPR